MRHRILASLGLALFAAPAAADAQQTPPDTTRSGVVRAEARGEVMLDANRGLTRAQVRQLQEALQRAGCNPGTPDGVLGPRTRQALACARRQRGIESANTNDVLRALDLGFTLSDSVAAGEVVAAAGGTPNYGDPTFVRDSGLIRINADTMPAGLLEGSSVFVPSVTRSRGLYLRETSLDRRSTDVLVPVDSTRRPPPPPPPTADTPTRRDSTPVIRRDSVPAVRRDSAVTRMERTVERADSLLRRVDTARTTRADTLRPRVDTTVRRADTTRTALPDSTIRRMRDELLLTLPPRADTTRPDSTRARPDTTRTPPDTTRRRIPPAR